MHKNRFLFLVHACTLVFAFCACGSTPGQLPEEITKPGEQISQEENTPTEDLQGKITLFDIETEYDTNIRLCYPNFAELSVGEIYNSNDGHFYILFDSDGVVRYITEDYIQSGFYDGMCKHSPKYMMDETGRLFRPQYLQDDEEIIRYAKDDFGVVLWTAKKVDSLEGKVGNNTEDKIFLLSYADVDRYFDNYEDRICTPTDYAVSQGADVRTLDDGKTDAGWWWLRSPGETSSQASFVNVDGTRYTNRVGNGYLAVRPALWIDLGEWSFYGTK